MLRFAGFELDQRRAELRGPGGASIRLRPKTFLLLHKLVANAGHVVSKHELMDAVWPNVHVGEDSLFQCIREIRTALGDDERSLIKVVSGRGYLFDAEVSGEPTALAAIADPAASVARDVPGREIRETGGRFASVRALLPGFGAGATLTILAGVAALIGFAVAATILAPGLVLGPERPAIALTRISAKGDDGETASMAIGVTERLVAGFSAIENVRVMAPPAVAAGTPVPASAQSDYVLRGELERNGASWTLQARIVRAGSGEVAAVATVSVPGEGLDEQLRQSRLAAGVAGPLARSLNALLETVEMPSAAGAANSGSARVVIEQAMASINQTSRERFAVAQAMLEKALSGDPENVELQVALAGLQTRGLQMVWYDAATSAEAEADARDLLERALKRKPRSIAVLEAYCRFLTATNNFVESVVACARVTSFDPWNGSALYQLGLTQLHLGRFEDALGSFRLADSFDTPAVSRWTWLLGIGWANLLLGNERDAIAWMQKSIAITPASGRSHMLLAVAYQRLGRTEEARAAMARGIALRPGSTALNVGSPTRNASPAFVEAARQMIETMVEVGLPAE